MHASTHARKRGASGGSGGGGQRPCSLGLPRQVGVLVARRARLLRRHLPLGVPPPSAWLVHLLPNLDDDALEGDGVGREGLLSTAAALGAIKLLQHVADFAAAGAVLLHGHLRVVVRRAAVAVRRERIATALDEELDDVSVAGLARVVDRPLLHVVLRLHVRLQLHQPLQHRDVTLLGGQVNGLHVAEGHGVDVGLLLDQEV
mmetsp:Transcript_31572/g.93995  ORF Transcript_31572/g.93995 Transcript_31572/m.93995 type:complete len:202 (+) Transcript_31572:82-687(+)